MKILDRYILTEFFRSLAAILSVFVIMLMLYEILGAVDDISSHNPSLHSVVLYFLNVLPEQIIKVMPISVMFAVMFGLGALAKRKELLAMHACGISYIRMAMPVSITIMLISIGVFISSETFVPDCTARARYIEKVEIKGRMELVLTRSSNVTTRGIGNIFYDMESFDSQTNLMERPIITEVSDDGSTLKMRLDAVSARLIERTRDGASTVTMGTAETTDKRYSWLFTDAVRWTFDDAGVMVKREEFDQLEMPMEENLDRFLSTRRKTREMSLGELRDLSAIQAARTKTPYYYAIRMELHNRMAFPFASFFLGMLGFCFAVRSTVRSLVLEFGLALIYASGYYILMIVGQRAGSTGFLPPFIAGWGINILYCGFFLWRFNELRHVPK